MNMWQKISLGAMVLLLVAGFNILIPLPAHATGTCPLYIVCGWDGLNGTGTRWTVPNPAGICVNLPATMNDKWSSAYNRLPGGRNIILKEHANCQGTSWTIMNGHGSDSFGFPAPWGMNNSASSIQFFFGPTP